MKTYLEPSHREQLEERGFDATVIQFHRNGAVLRIRGIEYSLIRFGDGFIPHGQGKPLWEKPEYPQACLAIIYRHQYPYIPNRTKTHSQI